MKLWTTNEAQAYLPRLRQLLELVGADVVPGPVPGTLALPPGAEHAEAALAELEDRGVVLRQLPHGLVDFPAMGSDGEIYLLCWKVDEPELGWWHRPDAGFAGRQPLPLP